MAVNNDYPRAQQLAPDIKPADTTLSFLAFTGGSWAWRWQRSSLTMRREARTVTVQCTGTPGEDLTCSRSSSRRSVLSVAVAVLLGMSAASKAFAVSAAADAFASGNLDSLSANSEAVNGTEDDGEAIDPFTDEPPFTSQVFLDLNVGGAPSRRVTIGCYGSVVPKTVANFEELARRPAGKGGYAGTRVYRLLPGLTVQMGDVLQNNGRSGMSAAGGTMRAEGYRIKHTMPGIVSMVRGPEGSVDSRFFITTRPGDSGYLDAKGRSYVAFGRVIEGLNILTDLDRIGSRTGDSRPNASINITSCGVLQ
jgi:cyclophilin family peptidyl-prolyl cis-trans isomerase